MDYIFSPAKEPDAPAIFALYRSMIGTPGCTWSDDYPTEDLIMRDIRTDSLYVLQDARGQIIAAAAAGPDNELEDLPWDLRNPCDLARVAVTIPLQNQGVGSCLLQRVIPAVKARGFSGIRMLVSKTNPHALAFYDQNGFIRLDEVRMFGFDFYRYQMIFPTSVR